MYPGKHNRLLITYNFGVVCVLLPPRPPRLGGIELPEEGARLLPVLLGPEFLALETGPALQRCGRPGVADVVLGKR